MPFIHFQEGPNAGQSHELPEDGLTLGRDYSANVQILDTKVSSSHAMILFEKGQWWIYDLQSSNGTLLNGAETEAGTLEDGDVITIGASTIGFHFESDRSADSAPPALSPPTTTRSGSMPIRPASARAQSMQSQQSSKPAGHGCAGSSR